MKTYENIPDILKNEKRFVIWKNEERDNKNTKPPFNPRTLRYAKSSDSSTWASYEECCKVLETNKNFAGLGFMLGDGFVGVDLDHVRDPQSGNLTNDAAEIMQLLNSYAEISPSGTGIHVICKGTLPANGNKATLSGGGVIEMYSGGRYFTMTGDVICPNPVEVRSSELAKVHAKFIGKQSQPHQTPRHTSINVSDSELIKMACNSRNGSEFRMLMSGDTSGHAGDDSRADLALCNLLAFWCGGDSGRIDRIFRTSGLMRPKWDVKHGGKTYGQITIERAIADCRNVFCPQNEGDKISTTTSAAALPADTSSGNDLLKTLKKLQPHSKYQWSDRGIGELFADIFQDTARYNVTGKEWYVYTGKIWAEDTGGMHVQKLAKTLYDKLLTYANTINDDSQKQKYFEFILKYGNLSKREALIKDARDKFFISNNSLDKDQNLFNCQNGTLNLLDYTFKHHEPGDLLSKISNVNYDAYANSFEFDRYLKEIMKNDSEKIDYLQKILGYALTADTSLETCFIFYGATTRNGKSTLVETIGHLMGSTGGYALTMCPTTLAQKQNNDSRQASGDIARLSGCRFLNASEPPKRMIFDVALLKTLLGRDSITARFLHQREFEFIPVFKLFINTNYLPLIQDDTLFTSGRITVISFDRHFSIGEQDRGLKERLKRDDNISGIFNWLLLGLKKFRAEGAKMPECVKMSTMDYRSNSDKLGNFISECMEKTGKNSKGSEVYIRYKNWCESNGFGTENKSNFFEELRNKGIFSRLGTVDGVSVKNVVIGYELPFRDESKNPLYYLQE